MERWRKSVGEEVANYISIKAANRGTAVHHMVEDYLNNMSETECMLCKIKFKKEDVVFDINNIYTHYNCIVSKLFN